MYVRCGHRFQGEGLSAKLQGQAKAVFPKARPRSRPQLDQTNNFSVNHKKILCKSDTDKRKHIIYINIG